MKPRILWRSESVVLNTGYAVYAREVLKRLYKTDEFEIAELASYIDKYDPRLKNIPWKVYPVLPDKRNELAVKTYNHQANQFGDWIFEEVCNDFRPHIVSDIADYWMLSYQEISPFRKNFYWHIMPTSDSSPQNEQWLSTYSCADSTFAYQDWSLDVLRKESGGLINCIDSAPPCADEAFCPASIEEIATLKENLGLKDCKIVGTVMRNQRRKLFPDLFEAFRLFLNKTGRKDVYLYCHTSYPDMGWDLPKYLSKYGLYSKVLFTYVCKNCRHAYPSFFNDAMTYCKKCGNLTSSMASVQNGVSNEVLSKIYNMFDIYIQYSNSEGFGMPQVEAAACGVPIMGIDFSAMSDIIRKLEGYLLTPLKLDNELETGCRRAIPNNDEFAEKLEHFFHMDDAERTEKRNRTRELCLKYYNWDTTATKWANVFRKVNIEKYEKLWKSNAKIHIPSRSAPANVSNADFARWLIRDVLGEPERLNTYFEARLIRDLNYGASLGGMNGMYYNEMGAMFDRPNYVEFNREIAYKTFANLCERRNFWEREKERKNNA